ncbi:MAG TPA: acyl-CoA thioester hydrolase/BAAT C-terminal domain-containing protein [Candidatus Tyrphobacter sp.]
MKTPRLVGALACAATLLQAHASAQTPSASASPWPPPLPSNCSTVRQPFIGTICTPPNRGRHPAVILLGGSEGGDVLGRALAPLVAAHGYVAVSVAYFKEPGLPQVLVDIPVETIGRALNAIVARPDVDAAHIGILGGSKGGELALVAASTYPAITAVVADVPSPFAWMGLGQYGVPDGCSWTLGGKELPCVPADAAAGQQIGSEFMTHRPIVLRALYDASMQSDPAAVQAAYFHLERIHGPVLCLSGDDDQLWDSPEYCKMTMSYLQAHHHPYADRAIDYPNAGHTFLWAIHGPRSAITAISLPGGASMAFGGTVAGDQQAAAQAWPVIWQFLSRALGG